MRSIRKFYKISSQSLLLLEFLNAVVAIHMQYLRKMYNEI